MDDLPLPRMPINVLSSEEMQHLPVEDAAVEADAADVRRLMFGRLHGYPPAGSLKANLTASKDSSPSFR